MVRTKLVLKRTKIRQWPPKFQILLPEAKRIEIKKSGVPVRTVTVRRKTIKFTDRWNIQFKKKMLAPNWEDHDAKTSPIINCHANRQHTEPILQKIEKKSRTTVFTAKTC